MKLTRMLVLSLCCFLAGLLYYALAQQWLIVCYPVTQKNVRHTAVVEKRKVKLIYWHHEKWTTESVDLIWSSDKAKTIKYLLDSWLALLDEETIMGKKVSLQSALLSPSHHDVYLSFDRNPFSKEQSTFEKWHWVEGLLKTIRDNGILIQGVYFLVHHQPLHDYHLDFSNPWPSIGFLIEK